MSETEGNQITENTTESVNKSDDQSQSNNPSDPETRSVEDVQVNVDPQDTNVAVESNQMGTLEAALNDALQEGTSEKEKTNNDADTSAADETAPSENSAEANSVSEQKSNDEKPEEAAKEESSGSPAEEPTNDQQAETNAETTTSSTDGTVDDAKKDEVPTQSDSVVVDETTNPGASEDGAKITSVPQEAENKTETSEVSQPTNTGDSESPKEEANVEPASASTENKPEEEAKKQDAPAVLEPSTGAVEKPTTDVNLEDKLEAPVASTLRATASEPATTNPKTEKLGFWRNLFRIFRRNKSTNDSSSQPAASANANGATTLARDAKPTTETPKAVSTESAAPSSA